MRQSHISSENRTLQCLAFKYGLQEAEAVGDDAAAIQAINEFFDGADFRIGFELGNE